MQLLQDHYRWRGVLSTTICGEGQGPCTQQCDYLSTADVISTASRNSRLNRSRASSHRSCPGARSTGPPVSTVAGEVVGATLGNDVNLRDFEGRSALLLTEAKDNNASCAIGPVLRLFDDSFTIDDVRTLDITLRVEGPDGYLLQAVSSMSEISRDLLELVGHACGDHHQYPDGFALFTGTMFAPTDDRDEPGQGFTHTTGDVVTISTPRLGALVNIVTASEQAPRWTFGVRSLMRNLAARGLLGP